jgi:hypothetical protein
MHELIEKKVKEIAESQARIIELECQNACEKFNVTPEKLTIEYHVNTEIKIKVNAGHFKIVKNFTIDNGMIKETF